MQLSHSRIECFEKCRFKYKLRYLDGVKTLPPTEADNALILGTTLHTGIEKGLETAIHDYCFSYPVITDDHINEIIKLETLIPQAAAMLPPGGEFEAPILTADFIGFIDYLVPARTEQRLNGENQVIPDVFDLYDFKYSSNRQAYRNSPQLHLYKYFWEKQNPGKRIRNLYFLFVPKVKIKQKKGETLALFRRRLYEELDRVAPALVPVEYDGEKIVDWLLAVKAAYEEREFAPEKTYLCRYCEYRTYCESDGEYTYDLIFPEESR